MGLSIDAAAAAFAAEPASCLFYAFDFGVVAACFQSHRDRRRAAIAPEPAVIAVESRSEHAFIAGDAAVLLVARGGIGIGVRLAVGIVVHLSAIGFPRVGNFLAFGQGSLNFDALARLKRHRRFIGAGDGPWAITCLISTDAT